MSGIEKITSRIETDAKAEVDAILQEGQSKAEQVRSEYEAKAEQEAKAAEKAGQEAAQRQAQRLESAAEMEAKKRLLQTKQECLDEAFGKVQKQLNDLPDDKYADILASLAVKASKSGQEEVILSQRDYGRVGPKVVEKANAKLGKEKKTAQLKLSSERRDMNGGLTLRDGNVEVNCAFETQLRVLRENMAAEVAAILFS
jgi:V/A-type H+-transporting ATPase subunit E